MSSHSSHGKLLGFSGLFFNCNNFISWTSRSVILRRRKLVQRGTENIEDCNKNMEFQITNHFGLLLPGEVHVPKLLVNQSRQKVRAESKILWWLSFESSSPFTTIHSLTCTTLSLPNFSRNIFKVCRLKISKHLYLNFVFVPNSRHKQQNIEKTNTGWENFPTQWSWMTKSKPGNRRCWFYFSWYIVREKIMRNSNIWMKYNDFKGAIA